ncbi:MAG TPA: heme o synthase [Actinomycetota bacterium]|nr:heme o synthase [Actinomycetota bacterium]
MTRFQKLAVATTAMTLFLIGVGGTVRATASGLGCANNWPTCHGGLFPPLNFHAIVEYSHRISASVVVVLVLALAAYAWLKFRSVGTIFWPALASLLVVGSQAFLGELVVKSNLNPHLVVAHFATSLALLALVVATTVNAFRPRGGHFGPLAKLAVVVAGLTVTECILGAYVTQWGAALVYADWPLFDGRVIPTFGQPNDTIMFIHRVVAVALAVGIGVLLIAVIRASRHGVLRVLAWTAAAMWILQAMAGAAQIWTRLADWSVVSHVLGAAILWASSVGIACLAYRVTPGAPVAHAAAGERGAGRGHTAERVRAYFMLTKPRVIELLLITTVPAMVVADKGWPSPWLLAATLIGGSLAAGGAGAINCYVDRDIDDIMERTSGRPVPAGRIEPPRALVFGVVLELASFAFLWWTVNLAAASLAVGATVFYVFVYTLWLKRATPSNIVIGGAAGAAPVLVGWAAVTGRVGLPALVMFAIIFYWTPPHFWALSMRYEEDYASAKVPMLPVIQGRPATARHIVLYTLSLVGVSLVMAEWLGPIYLVLAVVLGALFVRRSLALLKAPDDNREAMRLFHFSIAYLSLLFVAMAADRLIGGSLTDVASTVVVITGAGIFAAFQLAIGVEAWRWRRRVASTAEV